MRCDEAPPDDIIQLLKNAESHQTWQLTDLEQLEMDGVPLYILLKTKASVAADSKHKVLVSGQ